MLKKTRRFVPAHEWTRISILLAVVGGFLDAYTYLLHGEVFANAQTGNIVLLGLSLARRDFWGAGYYFIPILAFFLGILVTEFFKRRFCGRSFDSWQHISLIVEIVMLAVIGFLPHGTPDAVVTVAVSFVCSMQVNSFRRVRGLPYASTMCTGNLRSATEELSSFLFDKKKEGLLRSLQYFAVIFIFCGGAVLGSVLIGLFKQRSIFVCVILLLAVLSLMLLDRQRKRAAGKQPI